MASARRVAFATFEGEPGLTGDDRLALGPLRSLGVEVVPWVWDRPGARPDADAVVLRSCWDSHRKPDAFRAWLDALASGPPVWNPPPVLAWNLSKAYLLELAAQGVAVPETRLLPRGSRAGDLPAGGAVVKPAVSLNGEDTHRFGPGESQALRATADRLLQAGDVLLQAFVPEIETVGETSLVFFEGRFSHAIRKRPRRGEFRVQVEHGGTREVAHPSATIVAQAERALAAIEPPTLYARVDGVEVGGTLVLMELELIDPMLFLGYDPGAPERFAAALARRLGG